jgi:hypothetical protein
LAGERYGLVQPSAVVGGAPLARKPKVVDADAGKH